MPRRNQRRREVPSYVAVPPVVQEILQTGERQATIADCGLPQTLPPARLASDPRTLGIDFEVCTCCSREVEIAQSHVSNDHRAFCNPCYSEHYTQCRVCSAEVPVGEDFYAANDEAPYCRGCYMTAFPNCQACSAEFPAADLLTAPDNTQMCRNCFDARFFECAGCGNVVGLDLVAYTDEYDGDNYCSCCAPNDEDDDEAEWDQGGRVVGENFARIGSRRRFGVELEISSCTKHAGLRGQTVFGVKYDGSLSSGKEFVSPVLQGDEGLEAVDNLCAYGKTNDWTVDSSCGYHVHIDCGDLNDIALKSVALAYALTADVWGRFVTPKRRDNRYCERLPYSAEQIRGVNFATILDMTQDRYHWLNWQAYNRHHTVEVRLHSGTTNAEKVNNWVIIHARFVDAMAGMPSEEVWNTFAGKSVAEQFDAIMRLAGDDKLRRYYERRAAKHGQPIVPDVAAVPVAMTDVELAA